MKPSNETVNAALRSIESTELPDDHPRRLAAEAVKRYRRGTAISRNYDFSRQRKELKQVVYDAAVRYSRRRLWSRLFR